MGKFTFLKNICQRTGKYKIGNYLRELSVVIIGVAVTFYVSNIIQSNQEQRDTKLQLNSIYDELTYNKDQLEKLYGYYDRHEVISKYLHRFLTNPDEIDKDSISIISRYIGQTHIFIYKKGAYELFESSGAIKSFKNRNLLLKISDCYALLERNKESYQEYANIKLNEIQKLYNTDTKFHLTEDSWFTAPEFRSVINFYLAITREPDREEIKELEEVLSELESYVGAHN